METEKVCLKFTDLTDVPNFYSQSSCLVVNQSGDALTFSTELKLDDVKTGKLECCDLNVLKDSHFEGTANMKSIFCENISCNDKLSVQKIKSSSLETESLKSSKIESEVSQINNIQAVSIRATDLNSENSVVNSLRVVNSIDIPENLYATNIKTKSITSEQSQFSELKSTFINADVVSVNSLQVNSINVETGCFKHLGGVNIDMETLQCDKFHLHTLQVDGCKDIPMVKETFEGILLPQVSSKYIWFGKLQSSTKLIEFKVKSVLDVLAEYVPVVNFHTYENPIRLAENFQVNTLVVPGDMPDSFIVKLMFNGNLPATSKFILSVILQKI